MAKVKITVITTTVALFIFTALFSILTIKTDNSACLTAAITFGTTLYHFAMRLFIGQIVGKKFNYHNFWFSEKKFEKALYKKLRVKKWKDKMPSYNPNSYTIKNIKLKEVVNTMCRNEVIHEIIALLSFVPILFSTVFDAELVFIITSVAACFFDLIFVIIQRYNRPRLVKIIEKKNKIEEKISKSTDAK